MSAKKALERFYNRQLREIGRGHAPKRRNAKPEQLVKQQVMAWLKSKGFDCHVVESKAVFSKSANRYIRSQTTPGFSDVVGTCPTGRAVFVELKAPGKRSTLRPNQREFLLAKIERGAFAVCVDSVERLEKIWTDFSHRMKMDPQLGKAALLRHLPSSEKSDDPELW